MIAKRMLGETRSGAASLRFGGKKTSSPVATVKAKGASASTAGAARHQKHCVAEATIEKDATVVKTALAVAAARKQQLDTAKRFRLGPVLRETIFGEVRRAWMKAGQPQAEEAEAPSANAKANPNANGSGSGSGSGSDGEKENGRDLVDEMPVAVKVSHKKRLKSRALEDPVAEAKILARLGADGGHPAVLRMLAQWEDKESHFTALEWCPGGELFEHVAAKGRLSSANAKRLFRQLVSGLRFMHERNVAHLDVSLENLLLTDTDLSRAELKIADFGMAREVRVWPNATSSRPGKLGTMAPEVLAGRPFHAAQADVWSAGVVLFMMLTGLPPYKTPSNDDARFRLVFTGRVGRLLSHWGVLDKLDRDAVDLISRMLSPADTRITMADVLEHDWLTDEEDEV